MQTDHIGNFKRHLRLYSVFHRSDFIRLDGKMREVVNIFPNGLGVRNPTDYKFIRAAIDDEGSIKIGLVQVSGGGPSELIRKYERLSAPHWPVLKKSKTYKAFLEKEGARVCT